MDLFVNLEQINLSNIKNNIEFLISVLNSKTFVSGKISTQTLESKKFIKSLLEYKNAKKKSLIDEEIPLAIAAVFYKLQESLIYQELI